jgi:pSer/pThr/pTyr-binding forkhead associated (FHA) protein
MEQNADELRPNRPMDGSEDLYRIACGMQRNYSLTLRHIATGEKFEHRMATPTVIVGSDRRCAFRLPAAIASSKELLVQVVGGRLFSLALGDSDDEGKRVKRCALSSSGMEINGFEIRAFEEQGSNAEVERTVDLTGADADETLLKGRYELAQRNEGRQAFVVPLDRPVIVMGRSPRCRVCFNTWSASRFHAACITTMSGVWVVDLLSRTGTFVKEIPVRIQQLKPGNRLRIGPSRFEFRLAKGWPSEPLEEAPAPAQIVPASTRGVQVYESDERDSDERLSLVNSIAAALSRNSTQQSSLVDDRSVVRALNEMLKMQSLQLGEIRRLNDYLTSHKVSPQALLELGRRRGDDTARPPADLIKPSGTLAGDGPEPDVHEWFQEENSETAEERSVAGLLRRILGGR